MSAALFVRLFEMEWWSLCIPIVHEIKCYFCVVKHVIMTNLNNDLMDHCYSTTALQDLPEAVDLKVSRFDDNIKRQKRLS